LHTITVYTSQHQCKLCDDALSEIAEALEILTFRLEIIDIESDFFLQEKYKNNIPVIFLNSTEIARHRINKEEIVEYLNKR
jgi:alkyl hydroperoxide reductase subunit AhpF